MGSSFMGWKGFPSFILTELAEASAENLTSNQAFNRIIKNASLAQKVFIRSSTFQQSLGQDAA